MPGFYLSFLAFLFGILFSVSGFTADTYTWVDSSWGMTQLSIRSVDVCPFDPDKILCASDAFIFLSLDHGKTWDQVFRIPGRKQRVIHQVKPDEIRPDDLSISKDDFDEDYLRREGILQNDETIDDISEAEFFERMKDAGLLDEYMDNNNELKIETEMDKEGWAARSYQIRWSPQNCHQAFLATEQGLFWSDSGGRRWTVYRNNLNGDALKTYGLAMTEHFIVVGTADGLYFSRPAEAHFNPVPGASEHEKYPDVETVVSRNDEIVALSETDVYSGKVSVSLKKLAVSFGKSSGTFKSIAANNQGDILVATSRDIFLYKHAWNMLPNIFLGGADIRDLVFWNQTACAATDRGVFRFALNTSTGNFVNDGLFELDITDICRSRDDQTPLWIASRTGVFAYRIQEIPEKENTAWTSGNFKDLPPLNEVIVVALRFAESDIFRDKEWMTNLKKRSWLPEVNLKIAAYSDNDYDYSHSPLVTTSGNSVFIGPEDEKFTHSTDSDYLFELRMRWFPGKMLMDIEEISVQRQLAKEIKRQRKLISKVRQLYARLVQARIEYSSATRLERRIGKYLQVRRLTADLDALTGNYFSGSLNDREMRERSSL